MAVEYVWSITAKGKKQAATITVSPRNQLRWVYTRKAKKVLYWLNQYHAMATWLVVAKVTSISTTDALKILNKLVRDGLATKRKLTA